MRRKDLPPQHKVAKMVGVKCKYCSKIGHLKDCRKKSTDAKEKICFHSRKPGHMAFQYPEKTIDYIINY